MTHALLFDGAGGPCVSVVSEDARAPGESIVDYLTRMIPLAVPEAYRDSARVVTREEADAAVANAPAPVPQSITARQLRIGLVMAEWITEAEAVAWRKGEALPAPVQAVIDAMPAQQRFIAKETAFSMSVAERDNPLLLSAAEAAMPDADEQEISDALDQAFREWSQI